MIRRSSVRVRPPVISPGGRPVELRQHITIPVLMLNGRYDWYFPLETSQRPMFRLLVTPPREKRMVLSEAGFVPCTHLIKETLDWLDRYLWPVQ